MVSNRNRLQPEQNIAVVERSGRARIPTAHGDFTAFSYRDSSGLEQIAYVAGRLDDAGNLDSATEANNGAPPIVRVHSECLTGDVLGSLRCDCGSQLERALDIIGSSGHGILVYLRGHEGRGIGLGHKLQAYELQDGGLDTVEANEALGFPADSRDYGVAAAMLRDLGTTKVRLLSNNPAKSSGLSQHGIEVVEQLPLTGAITADNARYLETKRLRMDHALEPQHHLDSSTPAP